MRAKEAETTPLVGLDAGWLYVIAGLAVCVAGVLIPARADLEDQRWRLEALHREEMVMSSRLGAHGEFLEQLDHGDAALIRRLAATQLNLMPSGDVPLLLDVSAGNGIAEWVDARVAAGPERIEPLRRESLLARLAIGPMRLWLLGGGAFCVFIGLLLSPELGRPARAGVAQRGERRRRRLQIHPGPALANTAGLRHHAGPNQEDADVVDIDRELMPWGAAGALTEVAAEGSDLERSGVSAALCAGATVARSGEPDDTSFNPATVDEFESEEDEDVVYDDEDEEYEDEEYEEDEEDEEEADDEEADEEEDEDEEDDEEEDEDDEEDEDEEDDEDDEDEEDEEWEEDEEDEDEEWDGELEVGFDDED